MAYSLYLSILVAFFSYYTQASHWAHEQAQLPTHPDYRFERLDNGFSYAWHHAKENAGNRCQVYLYVDVGGREEEQHEQGMAHFLEHMAFKSNKYTSKDLIKAMESLGLSFGVHTNAHTTYNETVYKFDLGDCKKESLLQIFSAVHGIADGLLFDEKEVQNEKGVVDAEDTLGLQRASKIGSNPFVEAAPELARLNAIGQKSIRDNFTAELVRKFYEKWYVPQGMKLLVVSNIAELDEVMTKDVPLIFGPMKASHYHPRTSIQVAHVNDVSIAHQDVSMPFVVGMWGRLQKGNVLNRDRSGMIEHEKRMIVLSLLRARMEQQLGEKLESFGKLLLLDQVMNTLGGMPQAQETRMPLLGIFLDTQVLGSNVVAPLAVFERIVEMALSEGFSESELRETIKNYGEDLAGPKKKQEGDSYHIDALLNDARGFIAPLSTDQRQSLIVPEIMQFTPNQAQSILKALWSGSEASILMGQIPSADINQIKSLLRKEKESLILRPYTPFAKKNIMYAHEAASKAALVITQETNGEVTNVLFENGLKLKVFHRGSDEKGKFQITIKTPMSTTGPQIRKHHVVADQFLGQFKNLIGMKGHTPTELKELFPPEYQDFYFRWDHNGHEMISHGPHNDRQGRQLLKQLELLSGYFHGYQIVSKEFKQLKANKVFEINQMVDSVFGDFQSRVFGKDAACEYVQPSAADLADMTEEDLLISMKPLLQDGPLEIVFFGAEPVDEVIEAVSKTFGQLASRKENSILASETQPFRPLMTSGIVMKVNIPALKQGQVFMYYPLAGITEAQDKDITWGAMQLINILVKDRINQIARHSYGASYVVQSYIRSKRYGNMKNGVLEISFDVKPEQAEQILPEVVREIAALSKAGPGEEEFLRAKAQYKDIACEKLTIEHIKTMAKEIVRDDLVSYAIASPVL